MRFIFVLLTLGLVNITLLAQTTEEDSNFLLKPEDIFVEGVEWSIREEISPVTYPVRVNYEQRQISVYEDSNGTWQEFPFPENISNLVGTPTLNHGMLRLTVQYISDQYGIVLLNPDTGEYTIPPTVCDWYILRTEPGQGRWYPVYRDDSYTEAYLCNSETGEVRDILPADYGNWSINLSPDEKTYVLIAQANGYGNFSVFTWEKNQELVESGSIRANLDGVLDICGWVSDTKGLLCRTDRYQRRWAGIAYYAFDTTQPDSIEYLFNDWSGNTFSIENPKRYISMYSEDYVADFTGSIPQEHIPCNIKTYDTNGISHYNTGYECLPLLFTDFLHIPFYSIGDSLYYLYTSDENASTTTLARFNARTQTINDFIYFGEFESIIGVSPDEEYIILLMDDNGALDFPWQSMACCNYGLHYQVVILHIESQRIVYVSEAIGVYTSEQVHWIDNETVVIFATTTSDNHIANDEGGQLMYPVASSIRRISFGERVLVSITNSFSIDSQIANASYSHYYISREQELIDLCTFETIPVLRDDIPDDYNVLLNFDSDLLIASIVHNNDYRTQMHYEISLDYEDC